MLKETSIRYLRNFTITAATIAAGYGAYTYIAKSISSIKWPYNYSEMYQQLRENNGAFETRAREIEDQLITQQLLKFGFTCTRAECTANGMKIKSVSKYNDHGDNDVIKALSNSVYRTSYYFQSINNPELNTSLTLTVGFTYFPIFPNLPNLAGYGRTPYETIRFEFGNLMSWEYARPESYYLIDRRKPYVSQLFSLIKAIDISTNQDWRCTAPNRPRVFINESVSLTVPALGRMRLDEVYDTEEFKQYGCINITAANFARTYSVRPARLNMTLTQPTRTP